jgi:hypothetical protein
MLLLCKVVDGGRKVVRIGSRGERKQTAWNSLLAKRRVCAFSFKASSKLRIEFTGKG